MEDIEKEIVYEKEEVSKIKKYWIAFHRNIIINARFYVVFAFVILTYTIYIVDDMNSEIKSIKKEISNSYSKVVGLTSDGRYISMTRDKIKVGDKDPIVAWAIADYLVHSRHSLLDYSRKSKFLDPSDLMKSQDPNPNKKNLMTFYKYYLDKKKNKDGIQVATKDFIDFVRTLVAFIRTNRLPSDVSIQDIRYDKKKDWTVQGNRFKLNVKIDVIISGVTNGGIRYSNRRSFGEYKVIGYFDIKKMHEIHNPFGMQITRLKAKSAENATDLQIERSKAQIENVKVK